MENLDYAIGDNLKKNNPYNIDGDKSMSHLTGKRGSGETTS